MEAAGRVSILASVDCVVPFGAAAGVVSSTGEMGGGGMEVPSVRE